MLVRYLQTGYVLEAIVEGRSRSHEQLLSETGQVPDFVTETLAAAQAESEDHRHQLGTLLTTLDADRTHLSNLPAMAEQRSELGYTTVEEVLSDQLYSEYSAYQFYSHVIHSLSEHDSTVALPTADVLSILNDIRAEERDGFQEILAVIQSLGIASRAQTRRISI